MIAPSTSPSARSATPRSSPSRDDGPGIAAEDLPHIFDRFYRADKSRTTTALQHTGLGLAIVKTVVESDGGTVECQSTPGQGATFILTLLR